MIKDELKTEEEEKKKMTKHTKTIIEQLAFVACAHLCRLDSFLGALASVRHKT